MRVSQVPFDQGVNAAGPLNPTACVLHRTFGAWKGDYQVGKRGRVDSPGIGFHFLVGRDEGQWCQFYDTQVKTGHAKGANSWSFGIELTGTNADPLTDWQVRALAHILGEALAAHRIPATYVDGAAGRARVNGCLAHRAVPGSDHTDFITVADWGRVVAAMGAPVHSQQDTPPAPVPNPTTAPKDDDDMVIYIQHPNGTIARMTDDEIRDYPTPAHRDIDVYFDHLGGRPTDPYPISDAQWNLLHENRGPTR